MLSWGLHHCTNSVCLTTWTPLSLHVFLLSFFLPPSWGSPHHVQQWLEVRAQTIHRISPEGCAMSWQRRRWQSQSSGPKSARCHSTSSHLPADRTAPYLRQRDIRVVLKMWLSTRGSWPKWNRKDGSPTYNKSLSARALYSFCHQWPHFLGSQCFWITFLL